MPSAPVDLVPTVDPDREATRQAHQDALDALIAWVEPIVLEALRRALKPALDLVLADDPALVAAGAVFPIDTLDRISTGWVAEVDGRLVPLFGEVFQTGAMGAMLAHETTTGQARANTQRVLGTELDPLKDVLNVRSVAYLQDASNRLRGIGDTAWGSIRATLVDGFSKGETIAELRDRVRHEVSVSEARATVIARTEVVAAANAGAVALERAAGPGVALGYKEWLATNDHRTRPWHAAADGQRVALDEPFVVNGQPMDYPGDPGGGASNVVNCRCTVTFTDEPPDGPPPPITAKPETPPDRVVDSGGQPVKPHVPEPVGFAADVARLMREAEDARAPLAAPSPYRSRYSELRDALDDPARLPEVDAELARMKADDPVWAEGRTDDDLRKFARNSLAQRLDDEARALHEARDAEWEGWAKVPNSRLVDSARRATPELRAAEEASTRLGARIDQEIVERLEARGIHPPGGSITERDNRLAALRRERHEIRGRKDALYDETVETLLRDRPLAPTNTADFHLEVMEALDANPAYRDLVRRDEELLHAITSSDSVTGYRDAYAATAREVLDEVVPGGMGGGVIETPNGASAPVRGLLGRATEAYPTRLVERANLGRGLKVKASGTRAFYRNVDYDSGGSLMTVPSPKGQRGMAYAVETTVHEFGHRLESTIPGIKELEFAFHDRRTGDDPLRRLSSIHPGHGYRADEFAKEDKFASGYMGKVYGDGGPGQAWELMQMAAQGLLSPEASNSYFLQGLLDDADVRAWLLGVLMAVV